MVNIFSLVELEYDYTFECIERCDVYTEQIVRINEETRRCVEKYDHQYCVIGHTYMPEIDNF